MRRGGQVEREREHDGFVVIVVNLLVDDDKQFTRAILLATLRWSVYCKRSGDA